MDEKRRREDAFAARREDDIDRVVHAAGHDWLDAAAVGPASEDVRRLGDERRLAGALIPLLGKRSLGPVNPAVRAEIRAVQIVRAACQGLPLEPLAALVGHAVAFGVGQLPNTGRRGDIDRAGVPHRPFREHHLVGEDGALVEFAVAVGVFQSQNPVRSFLELLLHILIRTGRIGDVEPPLFIEVRGDRPIHQRRPGGQLDLEAGRQREGVAIQFDLLRFRRRLRVGDEQL